MHSKVRDSGLTLLLFILGFIQSLLILPLILKFWGSNNFGLWVLFMAALGLFRTLDNGHQTFIANLVGQSIVRGPHLVKNILSSAVVAASFLVIVQGVFFVILSYFGIDKVLLGFDLIHNIDNISLLVIILWIYLSSIGGLTTKFYPFVGLYSRAQVFGLLQKILEIGLILLLVMNDFSVTQAIFYYSLVMMFFSIITILDSSLKFPLYVISFKSVNVLFGFKNLRKSLTLTLNNFMDQFISNLLNSIVVNLFNLATFSFYSTVRTMGNVSSQLAVLSIQPFQQEVLKFQMERKKLQASFFVYNYLLFIDVVILLPFVTLFSKIEKLYNFWTSSTFFYNERFVLALFVSLVFFSYGRFIVIQLALVNANNTLLKTTLVRLISSIFFAGILGYVFQSVVAFAWGCALGELIGSLVYPFFHLPKFMMNTELRSNLFIHVLFILGNILILTVSIYLNFNENIILSILFYSLGLYFIWKYLPVWYKKTLVRILKSIF